MPALPSGPDSRSRARAVPADLFPDVRGHAVAALGPVEGEGLAARLDDRVLGLRRRHPRGSPLIALAAFADDPVQLPRRAALPGLGPYARLVLASPGVELGEHEVLLPPGPTPGLSRTDLTHWWRGAGRRADERGSGPGTER